MKTLLALLALMASTSASAANCGSLLDHTVSDIAGTQESLCQYQGKVVLVVNTASYCGYTPQYKGLQALNEKYKSKGLVILGFPSNDFGEQEPGSPQEIAEFCKRTYDVTFPMFAKVVTRSGRQQSPIYTFLGSSGHLPAWNFSKYLIDKTGKVIAFYPSDVTPESPELQRAIMKALAAK